MEIVIQLEAVVQPPPVYASALAVKVICYATHGMYIFFVFYEWLNALIDI
jgi:hypothetical protein